MIIKKRITAATLLAAASLTFSPAAWSLGLGDITVESFLNEPLKVKIDLITRETDDMTSVTARLASADDYELIGASRDAIPVPVQFTVEDAEGDAFIVATSNLPMGDPIVRLIVEVNWSKGRLLREYMVFLDPPTYPEAAPLPRVDMRQAPPPAVTTAPAAAPTEAQTSTPAPAPQPAAATEQRVPSENEYGPVSSGQTLWSIASDWSRGTGLAVNQVMIAIQRENPEAFLQDNINLLKRGAILRMPKVDDVRTISRAEANSEVTAQEDAFRGRSSYQPVSSTDTPLLAEETAILVEDIAKQTEEAEELTTEEADLSPSISAEEANVEPAADLEAEAEAMAETEPELRDQLELVPPSAASDLDSAYGFEESADGNPDASVAVSALREDLALKEEELVTQQQQNEYMAERIEELEAELEAARQATVADADLANMQDRLSEQRVAEQAATPAKSSKEPWYSKYAGWLIGLLVVVAGGIGWIMSRRSDSDEIISVAAGDEEQIREIKDEAEEVLRVLEDSDEAAVAETVAEDEAEAEEGVSAEKAPEKKSDSSDEAEVLDEESSDPEIQLDLARAYISMGDKEAARVILQEVGNNGSEAQQEEAKKMLNQLIP